MTSEISKELYTKVSHLYEIFDHLSEQLKEVPLNFPQIIVVGQESAANRRIWSPTLAIQSQKTQCLWSGY